MKSDLKLLEIVKTNRRRIGVASVGLCSITRWCKRDGQFTSIEYKRMMKILKSHKPKGVSNGDHWFPWDGVERGKFLNMLIEKYS